MELNREREARGSDRDRKTENRTVEWTKEGAEEK